MSAARAQNTRSQGPRLAIPVKLGIIQEHLEQRTQWVLGRFLAPDIPFCICCSYELPDQKQVHQAALDHYQGPWTRLRIRHFWPPSCCWFPYPTSAYLSLACHHPLHASTPRHHAADLLMHHLQRHYQNFSKAPQRSRKRGLHARIPLLDLLANGRRLCKRRHVVL